MKKTITLITAILLLVSFSVCYAAEMNFTDVKSDDWFYKNLQELVQKNIASGYPDGTFKPGSTLKFEEFIKMLVAAVEEQPIELKEGQEWYQPYMEVAESKKYIAEQQSVPVGQNISRGTMAEILYNTLTEKENIKAYTDAELQYLSDRLTDVNKIDIKTLTINGLGVISGYPDGTFKPDNTLTRAEAVAVISRVINPELRNPVSMPDTRTLDELPPVDLARLYDYTTVNGKSVLDSGNNQEKYGSEHVINIVNDYIEYMKLTHNRDYRNMEGYAEKFEKQAAYCMNGKKEYKGKKYRGIRDYAIQYYKDSNNQKMLDFVMNKDDYFDNYANEWVKDTMNNKVVVQSKFYTEESLMYSFGGIVALRGTLRIKYDSHNNTDNMKNELDFVNSEAEEYVKRMINLEDSKYSMYLKYGDVTKIQVGKWYDIDLDIVMSGQAFVSDLPKDKSDLNYDIIYPLAITEVKR